MKNLDSYVEDLLYRHQCVIIPEFGAFVSNRKVAEISANKSFSPPQKELTFNSRLTYNDGLVAKHISEVEHTSYEEAQDYIKAVVAQWIQQLGAGEEITLANIGKFHKGGDDNLIFTPLSKENYLTDSFGMSSFTPNQIDKTKEENAPNTVLVGDNFEKGGALIENPNVSAEEAEAGKPKRKLGVIVKYAAVAIVGLSAISFATYSFLHQQQKAPEIAQQSSEPDPARVEKRLNEMVSNASFLDENPLVIKETPIEVAKDPILVKKRELEAKERAKQEAKEKARLLAEEKERNRREKENTIASEPKNNTPKIPKNTASTTTSNKPLSGKYFLIAGAFSTEKNANNRIKQLKTQGYNDAGIVGKNDKDLFLVAYKGFQNEADATSYKQELKGKGLETWIYSK